MLLLLCVIGRENEVWLCTTFGIVALAMPNSYVVQSVNWVWIGDAVTQFHLLRHAVNLA